MKKLVILFIAVLITIMLSTTLYFQSNKSKEIKVEDQNKNEVIIPQEKIIETSSVIQGIENTEQEKIVNEIKEAKDIPKVEEATEISKQSENKQNTNESNQLKTETKEEAKKTETPKNEVKSNEPVKSEEKPNFVACSQEDPVYKTNLNNYKQNNSSSRMYSSLEEAISFGESALSYGYGYFYSKGVTTIEGTNCSNNFYTVRLYIPAKTCGDNEMQYISADTPLVDIITYLQQKGYSCPEKNVN